MLASRRICLSRMLDLDRDDAVSTASQTAKLRGSGFLWVKRKLGAKKPSGCAA